MSDTTVRKKSVRKAILDRFLWILKNREDNHFEASLNYGEQFNGIVWIAAETGVISYHDAERLWNAMMYLANNREGFDNSDGDCFQQRVDNVRGFIEIIRPTFVSGREEKSETRGLFTYEYANETGRWFPLLKQPR